MAGLDDGGLSSINAFDDLCGEQFGASPSMSN
jgi:hypothetical protein